MPYYRCGSCGVTSYSAAGYSTVVTCPSCGDELVGRATGTFPPAPELRRGFPPAPESVVEARRALAVLALPTPLRRTLALVVSELVTNAVRHAGTPMSLLVSHGEDAVRVEVRDEGPGFDWSDPRPDGTGGGLGLVVIDALASEWGIDRSDNGCAVWCVIPRIA